jgi:hypothetical protein
MPLHHLWDENGDLRPVAAKKGCAFPHTLSPPQDDSRQLSEAALGGGHVLAESEIVRLVIPIIVLLRRVRSIILTSLYKQPYIRTSNDLCRTKVIGSWGRADGLRFCRKRFPDSKGFQYGNKRPRSSKKVV